jgi:hypothetical protein
MHRRNFLKAGMALSAGMVVPGAAGLLAWSPRAHAAELSVDLTARRGDVTMIDGTTALMFGFVQGSGISTPGPTLLCQEGDTITVELKNELSTPVVFHVGATNVRYPVNANDEIEFSFSAPPAGTYLYYDDQNNGVNRIMGLHGALVVMPAGVSDRPFSGGPQFVRQYKWLFSNVDPAWGQAVRNLGDYHVGSINPESFNPRYFMINGNAYENTHEYNTELMGQYDEPAYVRMLNAGGIVHAPHFHGNHVEMVVINYERFNAPYKNKDAVSMFPLDVREVVYPFKTPPDAYPPVSSQQIQHFPMHCHVEMSQTAGGGLYPHGAHAPIIMGQTPPNEPDLTRDANDLP